VKGRNRVDEGMRKYESRGRSRNGPLRVLCVREGSLNKKLPWTLKGEAVPVLGSK
jgi:hypothetical protein